MSTIAWFLICIGILAIFPGVPVALEIYFERKKERNESSKRSKKDD